MDDLQAPSFSCGVLTSKYLQRLHQNSAQSALSGNFALLLLIRQEVAPHPRCYNFVLDLIYFSFLKYCPFLLCCCSFVVFIGFIASILKRFYQDFAFGALKQRFFIFSRHCLWSCGILILLNADCCSILFIK